jgi:predicted Zn-dependent protease
LVTAPKEESVAKKKGGASSGGLDRQRVQAVERLLERGEFEAAAARLRRLIREYPKLPRLRQRLQEALGALDRKAEAAAEAQEWCLASPGSVAAWGAALATAAALGKFALVQEAADRLRALGQEVEPLPPRLPPEGRDEFFGVPYTLEDLTRYERGQVYLQAGRNGKAAEVLEGIAFPAARNNRALALFQLGAFDRALAEFLEVWRDVPANLFALDWASRLRLCSGDETGARELLSHLVAARPLRPEDAAGQVGCALFWGREDDAFQAFERARAEPWAEPGPDLADLVYMGGVCRARAGDLRAARALWTEARRLKPTHWAAAASLRDLDLAPERREGAPVAPPSSYFPGDFIRGVQEAAKQKAGGEDRLLALVGEYTGPMGNAYLWRVHGSADGLGRHLVCLVLQGRAKRGDDDAKAALFDLLTAVPGTDEDRFQLGRRLHILGLLPTDGRMRVRTRGEVRELAFRGYCVSDEPKDVGLPGASLAAMQEALGAFKQGRLEQAEGRLRELLDRHPGNPVLFLNLSAALLADGRDEEGERLLRQALEHDPDYLLGRCNLARILAGRGEMAQARALVEGLDQRERYHPDEFFTLHATLAVLEAGDGRREAAEGHLRIMDQMADQFGYRERMGAIRELVALARRVARREA